MTIYAIVSLVCAVVASAIAFTLPQFRRSAVITAGAFLLLALAIFGVDCAISCVRTGELYVPKR